MIIQEIKAYLKKYSFLVFEYHSEYYSLIRSKSILGPRYSFIATDAPPQQCTSLDKLCAQVSIGNDTLLADAIQDIKIPDWSDPSWESYNAVRHTAIVYGTEVHFFYHGTGYWIAHAIDGTSHLSDDFGNTQHFSSCRDLFEYARIDGRTLADIWDSVVVDAC